MPGYDKAPKDKKDDLIVDYILGLLKNKKIAPARIFSMADEYRKNKVKLGACLVSLKKMLPDIPDEVIEEFPIAIESNVGEMISK